MSPRPCCGRRRPTHASTRASAPTSPGSSARTGVSFDDYAALQRWSVDDPGAFWSSVWEHFDVRSSTDPGQPLADARMPGARWFPDARLNWAEHCLRLAGRAGDDVVLVARSQTRDRVTMTADELRDAVARTRAGLARLGVGPGDRVAAYLPNVPEAVVALLATASLGAIWSSCAPEFGTRSVVDRLSQVEPKVLLTIDGYRYAEREVDRSCRGGRHPCRAAQPRGHGRAPLPARRCRANPRCACLVGARGRSGRARLRARAVRSSAVRALQLGHDRPPEADRPRPRRDPPRAPQDPRAPPRPRRRGPVLLVQHHGLDDVELPGLRAGRRRHDRPVRRLTRPPRPVGAVADGRRGGRDLLRHLGSVPHGLPQGRPAPGRGRRPIASPGHRLDRLAAPGRGVPVRLRRDQPIGPSPVRLRRNRRVHRLRRSVAAGAGLGGRDLVPPPRLRRRGVLARRPAARRRAG